MISQSEIRQIAINSGADLFGVAPVDRFDNAPEGFHPVDIYKKTRSVIAFARRIPAETLYAESCVPFTHISTLAMQEVDMMTFHISSDLDSIWIKNVIIPTDDPYEYWDEETKTGRAAAGYVSIHALQKHLMVLLLTRSCAVRYQTTPMKRDTF